ncbi:MAG: rod shape-determining protein MreD [Polyangiales bacterium]
MQGARGSIIIVLVVFAMLLLQTVFSRLLAPYPFSPYLGLPFVFALATAPGVRILRGALTAFAVGYLYDLFTGNPLGLHTFVFVLGYFSAWLVGTLLSFRGIVFQMVLSFSLTLLLGGLLELIRGFTPGGIARSGLTLSIALLASALATAVLAPILFALVRLIDPESERAPT